ncbi:MAG: phosphodiester glycosidase family protein [Clostridia bacterium]|nr:phosphodiester glycosidase family protein [Clostridia bacterium]
MKKNVARILSVILSVMLLASIVPSSVFAAVNYNHNSASSSDNYYSVVSKKDWEIAPGISESEIVLNNSTGSRRQVSHIMIADVTNEYVKVTTSYANMDTSVFATANMVEQAAAAEEKLGWNVVGAMNTCLSWYSGYPADHIHEPLGFMMIDGDILWDLTKKYGNLGFPTCVVINKDERPDGMAKVEMKSVTGLDSLTGYEEQVIPCSSGFIVKDGKNQYSASGAHADSQSAPRSVVGVTADGKVVIMENDGRQTISVGMGMYECAEMMIDLGCVFACNCDGGGSSTFLSQRPGAALEVVNSPSDGTPRETTNGILFVSTAPADGQFVQAHIYADNKYYTPGSTVTFNAIGTDLVGTAADIPAEATWQIKESGMGTIDNGVFVSNGTTGTVTAQLVYNNKVVGEESIEIVIPDIAFTASTFSVKYGTSSNLSVVATTNNGMNEVVLKPSDYTITCNNAAIGTINGDVFTAVNEANAPDNKTGTLTVTLNHGSNIKGTAKVVICKEITEVLFDFENGTSGWNIWEIDVEKYAKRGVNYSLSAANAENGQVHDGEGSLRLYTNQLSAKVFDGSKDYYQLVAAPEKSIILNDVQSYGVWVYINDEMYAHEFNMRYITDTNNDGIFDKVVSTSPISSLSIYQNFEESGWYYLNIPVGGKTIMIPGADYQTRSDLTAALKSAAIPKSCRAIHILAYPHTSNNILKDGTVNGEYTVYFDNFTVDYAADVADRTAPKFGTITLLSDSGAEDKDMTYGRTTKDSAFKDLAVTTTTDNVLDVVANVSDDGDGLNGATAKAYVDGKIVNSSYSAGKISISNIAVANGIHRIKFEICDRAGNKQVAVRLVQVNSDVKASTVIVEPKDASLDKLLFGSVYWMNLKATDIETVKSVTAKIDLNSSNHWELDNIEVASGFEASYTEDAETKTATITITRTGSNSDTGEAVLASLPIRIISFADDIKYPGLNEQTYWTNTNDHFWAQDLKVDVDYGEIEYVDGYSANTIGTFSNESFSVSTEMYKPQNDLATTTYFAEHGGVHVHTVTALEDKAPSCKEAGYTGRTYCEVCDSVVAWGTKIPTVEHNFEYSDGEFVCTVCGDKYNPGTGLFEMNGKTYYAINGQLVSGWQQIEDDYYYFSPTTFTTVESIGTGAKTFYFDENGKLISGIWVEEAGGLRYYYGPSYYRAANNATNKFVEIDGITYGFDTAGHIYKGVVQIKTSRDTAALYEFDAATGEFIRNITETGFYDAANGNKYYIDANGALEHHGVIKLGDDYYYIASYGRLEFGTVKWISDTWTNGLIEKGNYQIDENGKIVDPKVIGGATEDPEEPVVEPGTENGIVNGVYYENGVPAHKGVIKIDDDYYYVGSNGVVAKDTVKWVAEMWANGLIVKGNYTIDENGKILNPVVVDTTEEPEQPGVEPENKEGIVNGIYYENNAPVHKGVIKIDDDYYYVGSNGVVAKDTVKWVAEMWTNGLIVKGNYTIDENGKIVSPVVAGEVVTPDPEPEYKEGIINGVYYENNAPVHKGVVKIGDDYYYVGSNGVVAKDTVKWVAEMWTNGLIVKGNYTIDENGKIVNPVVVDTTEEPVVEPENKEGIVNGVYYENNTPVHKGVIKIGDDYYYIASNGVVVKDTIKWIAQSWTNGLLEKGNYVIDENGKIIL